MADEEEASNDYNGHLQEAAQPRTASGETLNMVTMSAPAGWCGFHWHPTHAILSDGEHEYQWNARAHRKMRYPQAAAAEEKHPEKIQQRFRIICWEPKIVTWYICWIGVIANTLWVVNGLYATWPEQAGNADPAMISYVTGVIGAFLFIVTGYLGYVEAINQTYADVKLPVKEAESRKFVLPRSHYGQFRSPIGYDEYHVLKHTGKQDRLLQEGYPVVQDHSSKLPLTAPLYENFLQKLGNKTKAEEIVIGRKWDIRMGNHVFGITVDSWEVRDEEKASSGIASSSSRGSTYRWWTWKPDLSYIGIFNALVFFVATLIFFIPAVAWWPMEKNGAKLGKAIVVAYQ